MRRHTKTHHKDHNTGYCKGHCTGSDQDAYYKGYEKGSYTLGVTILRYCISYYCIRATMSLNRRDSECYYKGCYKAYCRRRPSEGQNV